MMTAHPHILVNSLQRSGGSLIARLLDGHPRVRSMPFELLYAPQKVRLPEAVELERLMSSWEEFKAGMLFRDNYERIAARSYFGKDLYSKAPIEFDFARFESLVQHWYDSPAASKDYAAAVSACVDAFFDAWLGSASASEPDGVHVNHLSMMCYADSARFYELFPSGKVIQSLRDPYSWYASVKRHFGISDMNRTYMAYALEIWVESVLRGIAASKFWPDRYFVVRYSDLVADCGGTMRSVSNFLGLEFESILTRPTLAGREWLGNSSFGAKKGVDSMSLDAWRQYLTSAEVEFLTEGSGAVGALVAGPEWRPDNLPSSLRHPTSGIEEALTAASHHEFLANECRRMSLLTYQAFTRTIQRAEAARYAGAVRGKATMGTFRNMIGNGVLSRLARLFR